MKIYKCQINSITNNLTLKRKPDTQKHKKNTTQTHIKTHTL